MAHVIGIPLYKGNSESIRSVKLYSPNADFSAYFEGQAVFGGFSADGDAMAFPTFGAVGAGDDDRILGFIMDINRKSGVASLVRAAEAVVLPGSDAKPEPGDSISIDLNTGKIGSGAVGERLTNGVCVSNNVSGVDGKTGKAVDDCLMIRFPALADLGAVA